MNALICIVALIGGLIWAWNSVCVIKEWERGVLLRLGRMMPKPLGPGLQLILWPIDILYRVSVVQQTLTIAAQDLIAQGDAVVKAGGVCQFRVRDPALAIASVQNYRSALGELASQTMRQAARKFTVEDFLYAPEKISEQVKHSLEQAAGDWGLNVLLFEVQSETH